MGALEIAFCAWLGYVVTASLLYGWYGLKHHPVHNGVKKRWYHILWIIWDLPVILITYAGALFIFFVFKMLGLSPNKK